jgi:hypothetical protein
MSAGVSGGRLLRPCPASDLRCVRQPDVLGGGQPYAAVRGYARAKAREVREGLRQEEGQMREETRESQEVCPRQPEEGWVISVFSRRVATAGSLMITVLVAVTSGASPALAETHPFLFSFGSFANPNGIAVDESAGDVYVADLVRLR